MTPARDPLEIVLTPGAARGRRGPGDCADLLGPRLVRPPRGVQRFREPPSPGPHLRAPRRRVHLEIAEGEIRAFVIGRAPYEVTIEVDPLRASPWRALKRRCAGQIGSLIELLRGRLSDRVMAEVSDPEHGLFPLPKQIRLSCSCPDWAVMCKHVAAVLYGVGARLDEQPELLFVLRGVDHQELIDVDAGMAVAAAAPAEGGRRLAEEDLGDIFGIELSPGRMDPGASPRADRSPGARSPTCAAASA